MVNGRPRPKRARQAQTPLAKHESEATLPHSPDEASSERRQRLLALAAHDLRTPLNTLNGFLEIVYDEMAGPLNEKQREFLGYARSSVQQVALLFENVLALSQGERAPRCEPVLLTEIISEAVNALEPTASAEGVTVSVIAESGARRPGYAQAEPPCISSERAALGHALRQVLANALHVTPEGGCVVVTLGHEPSTNRVCLSVADAGAPISAQECAALLAEDVGNDARARDAYRVEGPRGSGGYRLRLAIARLEIERLGGALALTPGVEAGLVARVRLPLA